MSESTVAAEPRSTKWQHFRLLLGDILIMVIATVFLVGCILLLREPLLALLAVILLVAIHVLNFWLLHKCCGIKITENRPSAASTSVSGDDISVISDSSWSQDLPPPYGPPPLYEELEFPDKEAPSNQSEGISQTCDI